MPCALPVMIATLPSSFMRTSWGPRLPPARARWQDVEEPAQLRCHGDGVREEEVMTAREDAHGRARDRSDDRGTLGRVHDPAVRAGEDEGRTADARQQRAEIIRAVAVQREDGAIEAERPVSGPALADGVMRDVRDDIGPN